MRQRWQLPRAGHFLQVAVTIDSHQSTVCGAASLQQALQPQSNVSTDRNTAAPAALMMHSRGASVRLLEPSV